MTYSIIFRDCGTEIERKSAPTQMEAIEKALRLIDCPEGEKLRVSNVLRGGEQIEFDDCETVEIVRTA